MNTTFVVSTSNENHFFSTLEEAQKDKKWGIDTMKKIGVKGDIILFEIPENEDEYVSAQDHFIKCLENETAEEIEKETV